MAFKHTAVDIGLKLMNSAHRAVRFISDGRLGDRLMGMQALELHVIGRKSGQRRSLMLTAPIHDEKRFDEDEQHVVVSVRPPGPVITRRGIGAVAVPVRCGKRRTTGQVLGERVRHYRERAGLRQEDLASRTAALGQPMNRVTIAKIEGAGRADARPADRTRADNATLVDVLVLALALDVPPPLLFVPLGESETTEVGNLRLHPHVLMDWVCGDEQIANLGKMRPQSESRWVGNTLPLELFRRLRTYQNEVIGPSRTSWQQNRTPIPLRSPPDSEQCSNVASATSITTSTRCAPRGSSPCDGAAPVVDAHGGTTNGGEVRGSIKKRGATWSYVVDLGKDHATGKRRQLYKRGFATKRLTDEALADALSEINRGQFVRPTRGTLADYLVHWLATRRPDLRPPTLYGYEKVVNKRIVPGIGHVKLSELDASTLEAWYGRLLASVAPTASR